MSERVRLAIASRTSTSCQTFHGAHCVLRKAYDLQPALHKKMTAVNHIISGVRHIDVAWVNDLEKEIQCVLGPENLNSSDAASAANSATKLMADAEVFTSSAASAATDGIPPVVNAVS
eukprot:225317-Karenia_brevis.AAC.1